MVTVLVVEPWNDWREHLLQRLQERGIRAETVTTRVAAEHLITRAFDAYIINSHLPRTEQGPHLPEHGLEVARMIRRQREGTTIKEGTTIHYLSYDSYARKIALQEGVQNLYDKNKGYTVLDEVVNNIIRTSDTSRTI